jgi:hypothetical protein
MTRSKLGLLGFCAVVLGLVAFNTGLASAEPGANWLILMSNGEVLTGAQLTAALGLSKETTMVLHSKILGLTVLYECNKIEAVNTNLLKNGTVAKEFNAEAKPVGFQIKFSECIAIIGGMIEPNCTPNAGGTQPGVILTNPLHGLLTLHEPKVNEKVELLKILPDVGNTIATIESSPSCIIGKKVPIIGKLYLKDCETVACATSTFLTHKVTHLVTVGPLTEMWMISETAEHVMSLLGVARAFLIGAHSGLAWAGDPA